MTEQKITELLRHAYHWGRNNGLNRSDKNFNDFLQTEVVKRALSIGSVRHSTNFHAKAIIKKLTSRPHLEDDDGYYDMVADEKQMVEIVEKYLSRHYA